MEVLDKTMKEILRFHLKCFQIWSGDEERGVVGVGEDVGEWSIEEGGKVVDVEEEEGGGEGAALRDAVGDG